MASAVSMTFVKSGFRVLKVALSYRNFDLSQEKQTGISSKFVFIFLNNFLSIYFRVIRKTRVVISNYN